MTALQEAIGPAVAATPPITLRLAGAGSFGGRRPQVAWAGIAGDDDGDADLTALVDLAGRSTTAARGLGLAVEDRPYRPHLTLGRWRPGAPADPDVLAPLAGFRGSPWPVREVALVESVLGAAPRHEPRAAWPVGGAVGGPPALAP